MGRGGGCAVHSGPGILLRLYGRRVHGHDRNEDRKDQALRRRTLKGDRHMFEFVIAGISAPIFLLVLTGMTVGMVGGFIGVGGGYMVTPALIVFGFPGYMASGIDVTHICGKSVVATIRHRQLGNIDWVLGLAMVGGTMMGVEMGVRILNWTKDLGLSGIALLFGSVGIMIGLFVYTQIETHRSHKRIDELTEGGTTVGRELKVSRIPHFFQSISLWPI
ncbi:MAG: sulfite exporter TauE/SafE family protein, partial [Deltaproteobacteria bacterium]|nr:sulfite exporter TauE/SafE family protein [Deltaproteobacteria bacterium]